MRYRHVARGAFLGAALLLCAPARAQDLPAGPHRDLVYAHCRTCHSLAYLTNSSGIDRDQWSSVLSSMRRLGMPKLPADERTQLLDYLGTYLGPNPPPASTASAGTADGPASGTAASIDGKKLFDQQCAACHQQNGHGVPGQFPPLAGNSDLFLSADFPVLAIIHGLQGPIEVRSKRYDAVMPAFSYLSDAKIAALVRYIRQAWGNDKLRPKGMAQADAAAVKAARTKASSASAVHTYRRSLE